MKHLFSYSGWTAFGVAAIFAAGCVGKQESAAVETPSPSSSPVPFASLAPGIKRIESIPNGIETPQGLRVPKGFQINVFAEGLNYPRRIAIAPGATPEKYDVFVTESRANRVRVLRETNGDGKADEKPIFVQNLSQPYGLAFHESGWLYVGNTDRVVRFPYKPGATSTNAPPEEITKLTQGGYNQHWTRNLLFSRDGKKLYVTVGSSCNTCEEDDPQRAAISVMNPDGSERRLFATGLRNPVGMDWDANGNLWTVVNERDRQGDDVPPDYLTQVKDGGFYGWPYAYVDIDGKIIPDPKFGKGNPEKVKNSLPGTVPVQAHSAALGVAFYPAQGNFGDEYSGDAFLAFHGSWNRSEPTGYKIVRVNFENGTPVSITDFVAGFLKGREVSGRPVDIQVAPDGALLFSDDHTGKIWRVSRVKD
jgi:glucose/arabinose dehydrogenase